MRTIHQLPEHIIAKIAAGEVIERPAYALKELLENSLDARSNFIQVFLEDGGMKKILVTDNGIGMSREDLHECFKHHSTSKLIPTQYLIGIKSFGFRGEALSSIASISDTTIKSRLSDEPAGTQIELHAGTLINSSTIGMPKGTTVIVEQLFSTVPARRKSLRTVRTELRYCTDIFLHTILAFPGIHFQFSHNNKIIFDFPKTNSAADRFTILYGSDIFEQFIPLIFQQDEISINGFIAKPHVTSSTTQKQYLLVNNRPVADKKISQTVKEAYGTLLDNTSYPLFVLSMTIPHERVDVNVHPRKERITFLNERVLLLAVTKSIQDTLKTHDVTYVTHPVWKTDSTANNMPEFATSILRDESYHWDELHISRIMKNSALTQFHNLYILTQTYNGILFIDQHAAHERILFEKYLRGFQKHKKSITKIQLRETVIQRFGHQEKQIITENKTLLNKLGFEFEDFGNDGLKITHLPDFFQDHDLTKLFTDTITSLSAGKKFDIDNQSLTMITYLACRNAIKAGDPLTKKQMKHLLELLEKTKNNATCPHGRPTKIEIPLRGIHKYFKR